MPAARGCQGPLSIAEAPACPASVARSQAQPQETRFPEQRLCGTSDAPEWVRPLGGRLEAHGWRDPAPVMSQTGSDLPLKIKTKQSKTQPCSGRRPTACNNHPFLTSMREALQANTSPIHKPPAVPKPKTIITIITITIPVIIVACILTVLCSMNKNHRRHVERTCSIQAAVETQEEAHSSWGDN